MKLKKFIKRFNDEYLKDVIIYSLLFLCIYSVILYIFGYYNKSFIWNIDGISQHIITLKYFRSLLIEFINTGKINTFIWNLGYGLDMFANLSYYSFGDFISYLSVLVSESNLESFYNLTVGIRMWFVGISFILYCRHKKIDGIGVILGAVMYTFCARMYIINFWHPYMMNVVALFPLLLIGVEKSIKDNKGLFLIFITFIVFLQGFYFSYMIFIITILYGIIYAINTYKKNIKLIIVQLLKTLACGLISLLLASFILYPSIIQFLNSTRTGNLREYIYSAEYYHNLSSSFTSPNGIWSCYIGLSPIFLIGLSNYLKEKKDYSVFLITMFLLIALIIPAIGSSLVGFSFPLNRWTFILCFYLSYMTAAVFNKDFILNYFKIKRILLIIIIYVSGLLVAESELWTTAIVNIFALTLVVFLYLSNTKKIKYRTFKNILCILVVSLGITYNIYYFFSPSGRTELKNYINNNTVYEELSTNYHYSDNYEEALNYIKDNDKDYYLILKYPNIFQTHNLGLYMGYNSIDYYYSINSKQYSSLSKDLENREYNVSYEIGEFNSRARITSLLGNKYLITSSKKYIPYGYSLINKYSDNTYIYKNDYSLPFAVLYSDYIDIDDFNNLTSYEKEISMLKTTALKEKHNTKKFDQYKKYIDKDYKIIKNEIYKDNKTVKNKIKVLDENEDYLTIKAENQKNKEIYLRISGLKYEDLSENEKLNIKLDEMSNLEIDKYKMSNKWINEDSSFKIYVKGNNHSVGESFKDSISSAYYYEDDCLFVNLGYYENWKGELKIVFNKPGNYSFDKVELIAVNYDSYKRDIKDLSKSKFNLIEYGSGYMKASINPTTDGIIQFNTNYSDGWKVYVDNKEVETFESNKYFLGIEISKGEHIVELKYETPYLKDGIKISRLTLYIFLLIILSRFTINFIFLKKTRK